MDLLLGLRATAPFTGTPIGGGQPGDAGDRVEG